LPYRKRPAGMLEADGCVPDTEASLRARSHTVYCPDLGDLGVLAVHMTLRNEAMKLIFIYGSPAVGKLTVAKELASITGYKISHNHLTFDLASSLFDPFSRPFGVLCEELRLKTFEIAARCGLEGMIFTFHNIVRLPMRQPRQAAG
jgi:hypothetical protein